MRTLQLVDNLTATWVSLVALGLLSVGGTLLCCTARDGRHAQCVVGRSLLATAAPGTATRSCTT